MPVIVTTTLTTIVGLDPTNTRK